MFCSCAGFLGGRQGYLFELVCVTTVLLHLAIFMDVCYNYLFNGGNLLKNIKKKLLMLLAVGYFGLFLHRGCNAVVF